MSLLVWIFGDWDLTDTITGRWIIRDIDSHETIDIKYVRYEIMYSEYFNKYKIATFGYKAKEHHLYSELVKRVHYMNIQIKSNQKS